MLRFPFRAVVLERAAFVCAHTPHRERELGIECRRKPGALREYGGFIIDAANAWVGLVVAGAAVQIAAVRCPAVHVPLAHVVEIRNAKPLT